MQFSATLLNTLATAIATALGSGGTLPVYTGNRPGDGNSATGTLLATLTSLAASTSGAVNTITATAATAVASGTPGYGRLLTSGSTSVIELSAGVGAVGTTGTVTVSGGAITAVPLGSGGSGYPSGTYSLPCVVTGGSGNDAIVLANIASNAVASFSIVNAGYNYSSAPTIVVPPPFDLTFSAAVSNGGTVTLTSGVINQGNV